MPAASQNFTDKPLVPFFLGGLCIAFLYGITTGQTAFYWSRSTKDRRTLRYAVLLLWLLDSVHSVLVPFSFYALLTNSFHDGVARLGMEALSDDLNTWSYQGVFFVTGLTDLIVKVILTYRIWRLTGKLLIVVVLSLFSTTAFVLSCVSAFIGDCLGSGALSCLYDTPVLGHINASTATTISMLTCVAASDIAVSVLLCVSLWRRRTGFASTERAIRLLILYSIEIGMLTSMVSVGSLITFIFVGYNNAGFIGAFWAVPKFSVNSLLALLNARRHITNEAGLLVTPYATYDSSTSIHNNRDREATPSQTRSCQTPRVLVKIERAVDINSGDVIEMAHLSSSSISKSISKSSNGL